MCPHMKWIKLYTEVLDDPKIQRLPKSVRWTATSCFLVAGEMEQGGYIGRLDDLAWRLRENEQEMASDIDVLVQVGIVEWDADELYVVKYAERQGVTTSRERTRRYREKQRDGGDDDVTSQERHGDALEERREDKTRLEENREEEESKTSAVASVPSSLIIAVDDVVDSWNAFAPQHGLSVVRALTDKRKKAIKRRAADVWPQIETIYEIIRSSSFLLGDNNRNWTVDFDFIWCTSDGALKILEGKYSNGTNKTTRATATGRNNGVTLTELRRSSVEAAAILERSRQARLDSDGAAGTVHRAPASSGAQGWHRGDA